MANWEATFAAVTARGPSCERCGAWTFRPEYVRLPGVIARLCPACLPLPSGLMSLKALFLTQVFRYDLDKYPADQPIMIAAEPPVLPPVEKL